MTEITCLLAMEIGRETFDLKGSAKQSEGEDKEKNKKYKSLTVSVQREKKDNDEDQSVGKIQQIEQDIVSILPAGLKAGGILDFVNTTLKQMPLIGDIVESILEAEISIGDLALVYTSREFDGVPEKEVSGSFKIELVADFSAKKVNLGILKINKFGFGVTLQLGKPGKP